MAGALRRESLILSFLFVCHKLLTFTLNVSVKAELLSLGILFGLTVPVGAFRPINCALKPTMVTLGIMDFELINLFQIRDA